MLVHAVNKYQVAKRNFKEEEKNQYLDKTGNTGAKEFFRASEFGNGDRKLVYSFFKHQLPSITRTPKSLRTLENGDYVHMRWQTAWDEMGIMLEPKLGDNGKYDEVRLASKDDDYLKQYPWELFGHYDALLDMNIVKAHAEGLCTVSSALNEETNKYEMEVELEDSYAKEIGLLNADGTLSEAYAPKKAVADIKSMNQWGFKRLKEKADISAIQGYIDQISLYMFMLNVPYGILFIEDKGGQDLVEIQVVWKDLHADVEYGFDVFGSQDNTQVRLTIDNARFFGVHEEDENGDSVVLTDGLLDRVDRLWGTVKALRALEVAGADLNDYAGVMPMRCSDNPAKFPCSWADGAEKCEFYEHCWNRNHQGVLTKTAEECPAEMRWELELPEHSGNVVLDARKLPAGMTQELLFQLVNVTEIDLTPFLLGDVPIAEKPLAEAVKTANTADMDDMLSPTGELILTVDTPAEAKEYEDTGSKCIDCLNCGKQVKYTRLAPGGIKKCPHCGNVNKVTR